MYGETFYGPHTAQHHNKTAPSRGRSLRPTWLLGHELCQYEHCVSSTYVSRITMTFVRSISIPLFLCPSEGPSFM